MTSSSDGHSLRFNTDDERNEFDVKLHELYLIQYHKEVLKYGIYASNQGKYVSNKFQLNGFDSKTMYNWYEEWLGKSI